MSKMQIPPHPSPEPSLSESKVFTLDQLPMRTMPNGGKSWNVIHGRLVTGETIAVHESTQPAGLPPNPPHKIGHSELIFVREGALEFLHDGKSERVSAGGVIFVSYGTLHTARNIGNGPATYFVIAIGGDTK
jgi:XRE family transcriptional regulator, regulator of sulfur utilization